MEGALGAEKDFGSEKNLTADDLRKFHYTVMMEYFDDPSTLAEYDSQAEAVKAVEDSLAAGKGATTKVYRIDIPGKDETVFGVALKGKDADDCSGDEFVMSRIDKSTPRHTAHLPYEIVVSDGTAYALFARFRIAINWPHLPMVASETGATFMNIMCSPGAIEEALITGLRRKTVETSSLPEAGRCSKLEPLPLQGLFFELLFRKSKPGLIHGVQTHRNSQRR